MAVTLSVRKKKMVICSYPCKIRPIAFLHRMNARLSHGYSMLGVAAKERNILYLDNICCYFGVGGMQI